ncbi:MATH domain and coiled-coil domain-containing protein At1g31400 [Arabidopsis lyrata subsp. lyrata]|uniref:MATH domain and coiled-coil domain-containing protein At1g31400 n=1 Tax=Arabidopsis lyrata subsp. lyrata TaxID=81972 RepID=UPI000A29EA9F|nr:MATH domain and coiled-coil domain-containing protein At1g31400 [Arabidopsis lyrata subsp. lyrata]|eukprot:XP_020866131.1 MATH domain and coiled-coil domain-containing protein At1g31400 [Arabidopsis lyrata subsp. lyrata]
MFSFILGLRDVVPLLYWFLVLAFACRRLLAYPKGNGDGFNKSFSLFLAVADSESLPNGWKRHIKYRLTVVNQMSEKLSKQEELQSWFDQNSLSWGYPAMLPLTKLVDENDGFLVNGEVKVVAEVGVLEVVGKSDVLVETLLVQESIDVNGFQVLPSQVDSVNNLFKNYPDIASKFCLENQLLRATYMNSLLCLTEILSQSPEKLSSVDLANAHCTLSSLTKAGFKLDWLEKKLKELRDTRVQQLEQDLKDLKEKFTLDDEDDFCRLCLRLWI